MDAHGCARGGPTLYTIPQSLTLSVKSHQVKLHQHKGSKAEVIEYKIFGKTGNNICGDCE